MGARPLVPHCPNPECQEQLSRYNFRTRYGVLHTMDRRPGIPTPVEPLQQKQRWQNHRMMTMTLHRCPDCQREWWSTSGSSQR